MKILANENIPSEIVFALRQENHDVYWIREKEPGAADISVIQRARLEKRILLTFDKDFGELVYHCGVESSVGIILLRVKPRSKKWLTEFVCALFKKTINWEGHFAVVSESHIRLLPLPKID